MEDFYYGYHVTNSNLLNSLKKLKTDGGNFAQFFTSSPIASQTNGIVAKYEKMAPSIIKYCKENNIKLVIHSAYLLNFAKQPETNNESFRTIKNDLIIADMLNCIGCVIHVGKYLDLEKKDAIKNMFNSLKDIINFIEIKQLKSKIILETAAGQGTELFVTKNNTLKPFSDFYNKFTKEQKKYLKVCIDTCHIFSAGICLNTKNNLIKFFDELKENIKLENVAVIHLNDSKVECGKCVDRHEVLGFGYIRLSSLRYIIKMANFYNLPCVLETKPEDKNHIPELTIIKDCIKN